MKHLKFFFIAILCGLSLYGIAQDTMKAHVIDIGQGSALLLEFPCGVMLVDTGGEANDIISADDELIKYLKKFFKGRPDLGDTIDVLMLSHPHKDHTYGTYAVYTDYRKKIKNVITNGENRYGSGVRAQRFIQDIISDREATLDESDDIGFVASKVEEIPIDGLTNKIIDPFDCANVKLLWGTLDKDPGWGNSGGKPNFWDQNNHSVVARVDFGEASLLLTGDLEVEAIESLLEKYDGNASILDVDFYLAGHHGSANGTTKEMVKAMSPELAVLSFGDKKRRRSWTAWSYGHPRRVIIDMLSEGVSGVRPSKKVWVADKVKKFSDYWIDEAVYGTGWDGHLVFEATKNGQWFGPDGGTITSRDKIVNNKINVNTASQSELESLPGIGPVRAAAIIKFLKDGGANFSKASDLGIVPGIGPATIEKFRHLISF